MDSELSKNAKLDLFLTEISIELLGNKMYDVNGTRQSKLFNLFKAVPEETLETHENMNELVCSLGYNNTNNLISPDGASSKAFLDEQFDYILEAANSSSTVNQSKIDFIREYKRDEKTHLEEITDMQIKKVTEKSKITARHNNNKLKLVRNEKSLIKRKQIIDNYHNDEREELLKKSMDTLRLIKYIIEDPKHLERKGELLGYVHILRNLKNNRAQYNSAAPEHCNGK
ncbi:unnamed protein product [Diamesa tonsa]